MSKTFTEISGWIVERIAHHAEIDPSEVDLDAEIIDYRLDSLLMVDITTKLQEWLGIGLSPSIFREMGTINATTQWVVENQEA